MRWADGEVSLSTLAKDGSRKSSSFSGGIIGAVILICVYLLLVGFVGWSTQTQILLAIIAAIWFLR